MQEILTDDELEELSHFKRPSKQRRWLAENGIQHFVRADGTVVVPRAALNNNNEQRPERREKPNLEGLAAEKRG